VASSTVCCSMADSCSPAPEESEVAAFSLREAALRPVSTVVCDSVAAAICVEEGARKSNLADVGKPPPGGCSCGRPVARYARLSG
jgi:hypothetical protein